MTEADESPINTADLADANVAEAHSEQEDKPNLMSYFNENEAAESEQANDGEADTLESANNTSASVSANAKKTKEDNVEASGIASDPTTTITPSPSPSDNQVSSSTESNSTKSPSVNKTDLLAEAERQAAIAAALNQTPSTSPSIVAGMARQLATGEYGGTVVALPPLPNEVGDNSNSTDLGKPIPLNTMKPVKFDHVKSVFCRLWLEEFEGGGEEEEKDSGGQLEIEEDGIEHDQSKEVHTEQLDGREANEEDVAGSKQQNDIGITLADDAIPPPPTDGATSKHSLLDPDKPKSSFTKKKLPIPDSFLRFLLLTARVPIILEEGSKQLHRSKQRLLQDSENNSYNVAQRCLDIYKSAKRAHEEILVGKQVDADDAVSAFFAACSGDDSINVNGKVPTSSNECSSPIKESPKSKKQPRKSVESPAATALSSASSVFSSVMSKMGKKDFKRLLHKQNDDHISPSSQPSSPNQLSTDYEITITQELLGLTVENVLERTIIRTLLPDGAALRSGAQIGSLIAKVGNVHTGDLTHFETIDELRRSQRPLKLTLRRIGDDVLREAREEMGRLIRGREEERGEEKTDAATRKNALDFDQILSERWPSGQKAAALPASVMTRKERIHRAGRELIRILALLVVGMEMELSTIATAVDCSSSSSADTRTRHLNEAIEITSKTLLEYAKKHLDMDDKFKDRSGGTTTSHGSSFYPVPPGRVGKKNVPPPPKSKKKGLDDTPLSRIGDALQRTTSFLVEPSSTTATALRWEIIDYLCVVLDLDSENELAEKEAASSTKGGDAGQMNDLGSAGSILKLIAVNCSTGDDSHVNIESGDVTDGESVSSTDQISSRSAGHSSYFGNPFLSVVHRLAASKSISARVSACSLGPVLWSHLDFPRQLQLRGVITRALHDVDLTVRKSTATVLHEIAELVFDRRSVPWLVLMCERSMTDPEPQLRAAAMTLTWHLAEHLPNAFLGDASKGSRSLRRLPPRTDPTFMDVYLLQCKLLPVASNLAEDKMPSVRLSVAAQCDRLCFAMGEHWFSVIIDLLQALLSDADERVRSEAVLCMPRLVESVVIGTSKGQTITVLESLLPQALKIQADSSPEVRAALASATGELLIFLVGAEDYNNNDTTPPSPGRGALSNPSQYKKYADETLIPILQKLLQDSNPEVTTASLRAVTNASRSSTNSSARIPSTSHTFDSIDDDLQSISSHQSLQSHTSYDRRKPVFIPVLSEEQVLRLLPTLSNLATSREWRVRQSAVEIVPALLGCTYRHETRNEISKFCLKLMSDRVDAVRKTAAECLCLGGSSLGRHGEDDGGEWITNIVVPHLKICSQSEDSKQRLLCLKMIEIIISNGLCPPTQRAESKADISLNSSFDTTSDSVCDAESLMKIILDIAASLACDNVANVRLNVGRTFGSVMLLLEKPDASFAVGILEKQLEEEQKRDGGGDCDVIYFSKQAISASSVPVPSRLSSNEWQMLEQVAA